MRLISLVVVTVAAACPVVLAASGVPSERQAELPEVPSVPTVEISPGVLMPLLNSGHPDDGNATEQEAATAWLEAGGRGLDTAFSYNNQDQVGAAVRSFLGNHSAVRRADLFVTTKIGGYPSSAANCTRERALAAVEEDLRELGLAYADLVLHHFPCPTQEGSMAVFRGLQDALGKGLARAIGVSNYKQDHLAALLSLEGSPPAVNQCQMSVGSHDDATIKFCAAKGIVYEAYSPLRHVDLKDAHLVRIAEAHNASTAQVALRWITQRDVVVATSPGSNGGFVSEDLDIFAFLLTDEDMEQLGNI